MAHGIFILAIAVRISLLIWGSWQDAHMQVRYTDIDYDVYTDAAAFITQGQSPFERSTYRYTPLLAILLTPNIYLHRAFGKVLFSAADIVAAWLFQILLSRRKVSKKLQNFGLCFWLFSPFTVAISTRGNGEALVTCMLLAMLVCIDNKNILAAAVLYGLAVHWRIYPIIFALPLMRYFALQQLKQRRSTRSSKPPLWQQIITKDGFIFGLVSGSLFLALGAIFHHLYGRQFLYEAYLYHLDRTDVRHNFSPYFYPAYLHTSSSSSSDGAWAFSLAQASSVLTLGWVLADDVAFSMFMQTFAMVAFNKVCTAQYFVWFLSFLPLVLPRVYKASADRKQWLMVSVGIWSVSLGHWLLWAYLLEFQGVSVHLGVWMAGIVYVGACANFMIAALQC